MYLVAIDNVRTLGIDNQGRNHTVLLVDLSEYKAASMDIYHDRQCFNCFLLQGLQCSQRYIELENRAVELVLWMRIYLARKQAPVGVVWCYHLWTFEPGSLVSIHCLQPTTLH